MISAFATVDGLVGRWQIDRDINDMKAGQLWQLQGQGTFTPSCQPHQLFFEEELIFVADSHGKITAGTMRAQQKYIWRKGKRGWEIFFADERFFVALNDSDAEQDVTHYCGDDVYSGNFTFYTQDYFQVIWQVAGPTKNYRSVSHFRKVKTE